MTQIQKLFIPGILSASAMAIGCAGPVTPLGGVGAVLPSQAKAAPWDSVSGNSAEGPALEITPTHQVLYGPAPVRLKIHDPTGDLENFELSVRYNGLDVTEAFRRGSTMGREWGQGTIWFENNQIRLPATSEHQIEFAYRNSAGAEAYLNYEPPVCHAFQATPVMTTSPFRAPTSLVRMIESNASEAGFNPAFFAALIAQESGFSSARVSSQRALGLTQVTSAAESEIIHQFATWPRYPGLEELPPVVVRILVMAGKINRMNEWRLDPERSIQGGMAFARALAQRWATDENLVPIRKSYAISETEYTRLILASYHSGYARVEAALLKYGRDWLSAPNLKEARKYVNSVFSYCDSFSESEVDDANPA